ncbi:hypothetical protein [Sulfurivermis fontis]|uniref:hypothetical protein n=1 Tax=Sulfurivermis fontis TaxID=1972068 RepID=UPI000FD6D0F0|nr:hypothetical protein [Sulfurivermis fontis]
MQQILDFIIANPLYGAGLAILLLLLVISLIKRAVKLVVVAVLLNVGYGYYLHDAAMSYYDKATRAVEDAAEQATDAAARAGEMIRLR